MVSEGTAPGRKDEMVRTARKLLAANGFKGWVVQDTELLVSPNGYVIEWDGTSPDGEVSPLILLGLI